MSYAVVQMEKLFQSNSRNGQCQSLLLIVYILIGIVTLEKLWGPQRMSLYNIHK